MPTSQKENMIMEEKSENWAVREKNNDFVLNETVPCWCQRNKYLNFVAEERRWRLSGWKDEGVESGVQRSRVRRHSWAGHFWVGGGRTQPSSILHNLFVQFQVRSNPSTWISRASSGRETILYLSATPGSGSRQGEGVKRLLLNPLRWWRSGGGFTFWERRKERFESDAWQMVKSHL